MSGVGTQPDVIVAGAGVIGLTTGVCLAEQGLRVELRARSEPAATTSAVASAMIRPSSQSGLDPDGTRARAGVEQFTALADTPGCGVVLRWGRLVSGAGDAAPAGSPRCAPDELPAGFADGVWARLPLVDMPVYLGYLTRRLVAAGGQIVHTEISSLEELASQAPLVANCTGLGSRELAADSTMRGVRGQHVVVDNPGLDEFFYEVPSGPDSTAYWPYGDHVVLGSTRVPDDERIEPDPAVAREIVDRCGQIEPRLRTARVRGHQVGLRPSRATVRLELETLGHTRCVHNYGHGSSGVTLSWGCARETTSLLTDNTTA